MPAPHAARRVARSCRRNVSVPPELRDLMHPLLSPDLSSGAMPRRRSRLRVPGVVLATLLLLGLAQLPASAHGQLASSATAAPTVAGIAIPLALAVGAIILVLVILLAITALTRHRHDDDRTFFDPDK